MDNRLDVVLWNLYQRMLRTSFFLLSNVSHAVTVGMNITDKSVRAVMNSQISDIFVFSDRNAYPFVVKDGWRGGQFYETPLVYHKDTHRFVGGHTKADVLTAQLCDGEATYDMSDFFYKVSWDPQNAPSLFELVLIFNMELGLYIPANVLSTYKLCVTDSDLTDHVIDLSSNGAAEPYVDWAGLSEEVTEEEVTEEEVTEDSPAPDTPPEPAQGVKTPAPAQGVKTPEPDNTRMIGQLFYMLSAMNTGSTPAYTVRSDADTDADAAAAAADVDASADAPAHTLPEQKPIDMDSVD